MSAPRPSLYLDEDVDVLLAALLRARGYRVTTTQDAGLRGATDLEQWRHATAENFVLFTHNRQDFEALAKQGMEAGRDHAGLILAFRRPPYELCRRALKVLADALATDFRNRLVYV